MAWENVYDVHHALYQDLPPKLHAVAASGRPGRFSTIALESRRSFRRQAKNSPDVAKISPSDAREWSCNVEPSAYFHPARALPSCTGGFSRNNLHHMRRMTGCVE
jgi:hypothetical protein